MLRRSRLILPKILSSDVPNAPHCPRPVPGSGWTIPAGAWSILSKLCSLNSDHRGKSFGSAASRLSGVSGVYSVCSTVPALGTRIRAKLQRCISWVRLHERSHHRPGAHSATGGRHGYQPLFGSHTISFRQKRIPTLQSPARWTHAEQLVVGSRWAGVAPITRTSMRKSQVSALCDDQQNEKCRNNDRGNEPAHNVTFICPAESIVNWLRHDVHMGTIISTGKLGPLPKPRSRTG